MKSRKVLVLSLIFLVLFSFVSGCAAVNRFDSFFAGGEFRQHARIIDFGLFFVIFFALCYLGFSMAFGKGFGKPADAKGPIVGLSLALALAFAFAIVSQTSFSITTMFPLAKAFFFIALWFVLWGLLSKSGIFGEHWGGKVVSAILAAIIIYLLACIFTHFVCQMSDNMHDPACKSDFFNALFNIGGRLFGVERWTWAGGGGYWPPSGTSPYPQPYYQPDIVPTEIAPTPITEEKEEKPVPEGDIQGGCRLDLEFVVNKHNTFSKGSASSVEDFVKSARTLGSTVHVYGFASVEGDEKRNRWLSRNRATFVSDLIKKADSKMNPDPDSKFTTTIFGKNAADLPPNRRVVLSTEPLSGSSFLPAPSAGKAVNCPPPGPGDYDADKASSWWWLLLLLIPLLLLLLFLANKRRFNIKEAIKKKSRFMDELKRIDNEKYQLHADIIKTDTGPMEEATMRQKAKSLIESIESDLRVHGRKSIQALAADYYPKRLNEIAKETADFGVDDQHARQVERIIKRICEHKKVYPKAQDFSEALVTTVAEMISKNNLLREYHDFFRKQVELKKKTEEFEKFEDRVLDYARKKYLAGIMQSTQDAKNLCEELRAKIQEVEGEEKNVMATHDARERQQLWKHYDDERKIIARLIKAVEKQRKHLSKMSVVIIKPKDGESFKPGDQPEFVAEVINGKPPFRYKVFWNEGIDDNRNALTPEETTDYYKIKFKLPERFRDLKIAESDNVFDKRYWHEGKQGNYRISMMLYDSTKKPSTYDYRVYGTAIPDCAMDSIVLNIAARPEAAAPPKKPGEEEKKKEEEKPEAPKGQLELPLKGIKIVPKKKSEEERQEEMPEERSRQLDLFEEARKKREKEAAEKEKEHEEVLKQIDETLAEAATGEEKRPAPAKKKAGTEPIEPPRISFNEPDEKGRNIMKIINPGDTVNQEDDINELKKKKPAERFYFAVKKNKNVRISGKVQMEMNIYKLSKPDKMPDGKGDMWIQPKRWHLFAKVGKKDFEKIRPNHLIDIPVIKDNETDVDIFPRFICPGDAEPGLYYLFVTLFHEGKENKKQVLHNSWMYIDVEKFE